MYSTFDNLSFSILSFTFSTITQFGDHKILFSHPIVTYLLIMVGFNLLSAVLTFAAVCNSVLASHLTVKRTGPVRLPSCVNYTPFVYSGCFADNGSPRALLYKSNLDFDSMTVEKCVAFCKGESVSQLSFRSS